MVAVPHDLSHHCSPLTWEVGRGKCDRSVMFWGLLGQQWASGLCVQLSVMQIENCRPGSVYYICMSGVIAVTSNSAIISRIRLMSKQCKGIQNLTL